jgi:hypothetical protein
MELLEGHRREQAARVTFNSSTTLAAFSLQSSDSLKPAAPAAGNAK